MTCTGGGDRTFRLSGRVRLLTHFSGEMHMKVWVKVRCQVVMTRTGAMTTGQIESRPDFQVVRSCES